MDSKFKNNSQNFKFGQDIFWVALSNFIIPLFGLITIPALTKTYSAELFGVWNQVLITSSLLVPILTLHLGTAAVRLLAAEKSNKVLSEALSNMLFFIILFIFIIVGVTWFARFEISDFLFVSTEYVSYVPLTFIWAGTSALFAFMISFLRSGGEIKRLSIIRLCYIISKVCFLIILAKFSYSLILIILSQIIVDLTFIIILYAYIIKRIGFSLPNLKNIKPYFNISIPDIPNGIIIWILNASDRYIITFYIGLSQVGIYSASYVLGSFISMFYTPISFVLFPYLTKFWENRDLTNVRIYLEYSLRYFLLLSIPATAGTFLFSKPLLNVLATSEYAVGGILTFMIALGTVFLGIYQINLYIIYLEKKNKYIPFITSISAIINISLNIILIPKIGIIGAAISTLIAYLILALIVTIWAQRSLNYYFDFKYLLKILISTLIMTICLSFGTILGVFTIILYGFLGILIYFVCILLFRTFSKNEKKFFIEILNQFIPSRFSF